MRRQGGAGTGRHAGRWLGVLLLLCAAAIGASSALGAKDRTKSVTAHSEGLTATLSATPDRVKPGAAVKLRLVVHAQHASGALDYELAYGDGTNAPPIVIPEYCLAGNLPPASASWHFSHRYRSAGLYHVAATVEVNCGGGHVRVSLPVHVG